MRCFFATAVSAASAMTFGCSSESGGSSGNVLVPANSAYERGERAPAAPRPEPDRESAWLVGRWGLDGDCDPEGTSILFRPSGQFDAPGAYGHLTWQLRDGVRLLLVSREPAGGEARPSEGHARNLLDTGVWQLRRVSPDRLALSNDRHEELYVRCAAEDA